MGAVPLIVASALPVTRLATVFTVTAPVVTLLPGVGSCKSLPAVVVTVTLPAVVGVNVVVHTIWLVPTGVVAAVRLTTGLTGVQVVAAPG